MSTQVSPPRNDKYPPSFPLTSLVIACSFLVQLRAVFETGAQSSMLLVVLRENASAMLCKYPNPKTVNKERPWNVKARVRGKVYFI